MERYISKPLLELIENLTLNCYAYIMCMGRLFVSQIRVMVFAIKAFICIVTVSFCYIFR